MMQWTQVDSGAMYQIGYDSETSELGIEFRPTRNIYIYSDVPLEEYAAFIAAESKGTYLNKVFKLRDYRHKILGNE